MEISHSCRWIDGMSKSLKTPNLSGNTFEKFPRLSKWNFPTLVKNILWSQKIRKIPKNSKNYPKIPTLARKGRKCEKCVGNSGKSWENSGINAQKFQKTLKKL